MTWLRIDVGLARHPKVHALASAMSCRPLEAVGIVVGLWSYAIEYHENGDLGAVEWRMIAGEVLRDPRKGARLEQALKRSGFVTSDNRLNDWQEYQGALLTRRELDRKRKAAQRERASASAGQRTDVTRTSATIPDRTNETKRTKRTTTSGAGAPGDTTPPSWVAAIHAELIQVGAAPYGLIGKLLGDLYQTYGDRLLPAAGAYRRMRHREGVEGAKYRKKSVVADFADQAGVFVDHITPLKDSESGREVLAEFGA